MKSEELIKRVNYFTFLFLCFVSPIHYRLLIYTFDLWVVTYIIEKIVLYKKDKLNFDSDRFKSLLPFFLLSITTAVSLIYSESIQTGLSLLIRRFALLIVPVFLFIGLNNHYNRIEIYTSIIYGVLVSMLFNLMNMLIDIIYVPKDFALWNISLHEFFYEKTSYLIHRFYWGIYALTGCIVCDSISLGRVRNSSTDYLFKILFYLAVITFLILLQSRIIFIMLALILLIKVYLIKNMRLSLIITIFSLLSLLSIGFVYFRFSAWSFSEFIDKFQQNEPRFQIWNSAFNLIKSKWFFGFGVGDVNKNLLEYYNALDFKEGISKQYNAHNQYLEFWLESGIFSVVFFILTIYILAKNLSKESLYIRISLIILIIIGALVESYLNRISGIVWFCTIIIISSLSSNTTDYSKNDEKWISTKFLNLFPIFTITTIFVAIVALVFFRPGYTSIDPKTYLPFVNYEKSNIDGNGSENISKKAIAAKIYVKDFTLSKSGNLELNLAIQNHFLRVGDSITSSIYCKVSEEYRGKVILLIGSPENGYSSNYYDMKNKGDWILLKKTRVNKRKFFVKEKTILTCIVNNPEDENAYVEFTYPEFKITPNLLKK